MTWVGSTSFGTNSSIAYFIWWQCSEPIIEIGDGRLMGTQGTSVHGKLHSEFLGIPYMPNHL
jgi:hypothetical protein